MADLADARREAEATAKYLLGVADESTLGEFEEELVDCIRSLLAAEPGARAETVHACPEGDAATMPCCGRSPFEVSVSDRVTLDPAHVTCRPALPPEVREAADRLRGEIRTWRREPHGSGANVVSVAGDLLRALAARGGRL